MNYIPLSVPNVSDVERALINKALDDNWVSSGGPYVDRFENDMREYVGARHAVACQSGTAGLHLALMALGVKAEDMVIVPTLTFIATVNPVKYVGAQPVFMDCDDRLNIDIDKLASFLETECEMESGILRHIQTRKPVKCLIVVHIFGYMVDMERVMELARRYNLKVIEDATEALGSKSSGKHAGTYADIGVYSFNGNKIITTGGGGIAVTESDELAGRMKYLSTQAKDDGLYYVHNEIGYNYRMTTMQACLGIGQLTRLESFIETKASNLDRYLKRLAGIEGISFIEQKLCDRPNRWFYAFAIDEARLALSRDELIRHLAEHRIESRPVWSLIHRQAPYRNCLAYNIDKALEMEKSVINLPCSTDLTTEEVDWVCDVIEQAASQSGK